jgi:hypothetical protein
LSKFFNIPEANIVLSLRGERVEFCTPITFIEVNKNEAILVLDSKADSDCLPPPARRRFPVGLCSGIEDRDPTINEMMRLDPTLSLSSAESIFRESQGDRDQALSILTSSQHMRSFFEEDLQLCPPEEPRKESALLWEMMQSCPDLSKEEAEEILSLHDSNLGLAIAFARENALPFWKRPRGKDKVRVSKPQSRKMSERAMNEFRKRMSGTVVHDYTPDQLWSVFDMIQTAEDKEMTIVQIFESCGRNADMTREVLSQGTLETRAGENAPPPDPSEDRD